MIPISTHKTILLQALSYVLCEPDEGSSCLKEYNQLKKIENSKFGSSEQKRAIAYFDGTPCQAYEHLPEEILYQEVTAWRDAILSGYQAAMKTVEPVVHNLQDRLEQWVEIADKEDQREEDTQAIDAAKKLFPPITP